MFLKQAKLDWREESPWSEEYQDVYFSRSGGLAESRHVFLGGNRLRQRFQKRNSFSIGEIGFGSGLNFLSAWHCWNECAPEPARLHYFSTELHPLSVKDLRRCLGHWPELRLLALELLEKYPAPLPGFHRVALGNGRVILNLMYGDARQQLSGLAESMDAWFLDGFSPQKNPALWNSDLFRMLAERTKPGGTLATYSVAGAVKSGLREAGFSLEKRVGFGNKREMLVGELTQPNSFSPSRPWFQLSESKSKISQPVLIIGAGLAGCACALALAERGIPSRIIEAGASLAQGASGNASGLVMPLLSRDQGLASRYYLEAYRTSLQHYRMLSGLRGALGEKGGVIQLAHSSAQARKNRQLLEVWRSPDLESTLIRETCCHPDLWKPEGPALLYAQGGWLEPFSVCQAQLKKAGSLVETDFNVAVETLEYRQGSWHCLNRAGMTSATGEIVILAQGSGITHLTQVEGLAVSLVGGQVSYLPSTENSRRWQQAVCFDGYLSPAQGGFHSLGATYRKDSAQLGVTLQDHEENLLKLRQVYGGKEFALRPDQLRGRFSYRVTTADRLPVVGPVPDWDWYSQVYADLSKGYPSNRYPAARYLPGLFVSGGHGSRGLVSTILAGEIIASQISGEPAPLEQPLMQAIHPARFRIRQLFSGKGGKQIGK